MVRMHIVATNIGMWSTKRFIPYIRKQSCLSTCKFIDHLELLTGGIESFSPQLNRRRYTSVCFRRRIRITESRARAICLHLGNRALNHQSCDTSLYLISSRIKHLPIPLHGSSQQWNCNFSSMPWTVSPFRCYPISHNIIANLYISLLSLRIFRVVLHR